MIALNLFWLPLAILILLLIFDFILFVVGKMYDTEIGLFAWMYTYIIIFINIVFYGIFAIIYFWNHIHFTFSYF